jgi:ring-1,2-phenylacetyl-CoA epoxidase subunit PaaC
MAANVSKQQALFEYCLRLGDNSLVLGHRLSEWCGHGPILEEDIAMINIALDLVGQSRTMLQYAAEVEGKGRSEDDLAYLRDVMDFRNCLMAEQPNGDFAVTMMRQLLITALNYHLYEALTSSKDATVAAFAEKSLKEVNYHLRHCGEWIVRLGDGTEESHERAQTALDDLWMFTSDLFETTEGDELLIKEGIAADMKTIRQNWEATIKEILERATLKMPESTYMMTGSRTGKHTEHLGYLLAELQFLPRAYPGAQW